MDYAELNSLVEKATLGDPKAFEEVCRAKGQSILYLCIKQMGNLQDGQDAAQETFIQMQKSLPTLQSAEAFTVWLQRLVLYTCNGMRRKKMKHDTVPQDEDFMETLPEFDLECLPEEYVLQTEKKGELLSIIDGLPDSMKTCVLLYYFEQMSAPEIAQVMKVSESTVNVQLHRARLKIRTAIETADPGAYANALLPMSSLGQVLQQQAAAQASGALISQCLAAAQIAPAAAVGTAAGGAASLLKLPLFRGLTAALAALGITGAVIFSFASTPLSANMPVVDDPQRTSQAAGGVEDMASSAIQDSTADAALFTPAPVQSAQSTVVPGTGSLPQPVAGTVAGTVYLKHNDGKVLRAAEELAGAQLILTDMAGRQVASGTLTGGGSYTLTVPQVEAQNYILTLTLPKGSVFSGSEENPGGRLGLALTPDAGVQADLFVQVNKTPDAELVLVGGVCECGHVNPERIVIKNNDVLAVTQSWEIVSAANRQVVATGSGANVQSELGALPDGLYTLKCTVTDEVGNKQQLKIDFTIISDPVKPGTFT